MRHRNRSWAVVVLLAALSGPASWPRATRSDELGDKLAPHVGKPLDLVELNSGKRFVRPVLEGLASRDDRTTAVRLRSDANARPVTIPLGGIARIVAARETVHEADGSGPGGAGSRSSRLRGRDERLREESQARMQARGVQPWPQLTAEQHAAELEQLEAFVEAVRREFPALAVSQTHEFIVASDIPAPQIAPFTARLDAMHDFLCDLYGIARGEPVWKGKCAVVAFQREEDFAAFERRFMQVDSRGAHGLCHQRSDGRVVMACHRGRSDDTSVFAHMLVHETSHGFNHRWMSPRPLPNWLNEGLAEWVGTQVVPACRQVPMKEARALGFMKSGGSVGEGFFSDDPDHHIDQMQYGVASGLVKFLVARDRRKFATFVRGIKEGMPFEESLRESFGASLDELVAAYGRAIGVPTLRR